MKTRTAGRIRGTVWKVFGPDWPRFHPYAGLRFVPAIAAPLVVGIATGQVAAGVVVAAGAFSVGFGSFHRLGGSCVRPMLLAALGMCIASWVGTVAGLSHVAAVCACAAATFVYALISCRSLAASWVALQCAIWLVISTAYPGHSLHALARGALILAGGLLQIAVTALGSRVANTCGPAVGGAPIPLSPIETKGETQRQALEIQSPRLFAIRATITVTIAAALYRALSVQNGYWIPITVLIVLRPGFQATTQRAFAFTVGTMAGAALATLIVTVTTLGLWVLTAGVALAAWACYALFHVNYAYFAACLTAYVVFLLSLVGYRQEPLIMHRVTFTALGGVLALAALFVDGRSSEKH